MTTKTQTTTAQAISPDRLAVPPPRDFQLIDADQEQSAISGWTALAGVSVLLLLLALIVPYELGAALCAIGLAGLFVVRLAARRFRP